MIIIIANVSHFMSFNPHHSHTQTSTTARNSHPLFKDGETEAQKASQLAHGHTASE